MPKRVRPDRSACGRASTDFDGASSGGALSKELRSVMSSSDLIESAGEVTPTWSIPVEALSFLYFDGQNWVEEWNSMNLMRMPWCIRIRVNFVRSAEESSEGGARTLVPEDEGDFQMYVPIPLAMGVRSDAATWQQILSGASSSGLNQGLVPVAGNPTSSTTSTSSGSNTVSSAGSGKQ